MSTSTKSILWVIRIAGVPHPTTVSASPDASEDSVRARWIKATGSKLRTWEIRAKPEGAPEISYTVKTGRRIHGKNLPASEVAGVLEEHPHAEVVDEVRRRIVIADTDGNPATIAAVPDLLADYERAHENIADDARKLQRKARLSQRKHPPGKRPITVQVSQGRPHGTLAVLSEADRKHFKLAAEGQKSGRFWSPNGTERAAIAGLRKRLKALGVKHGRVTIQRSGF